MTVAVRLVSVALAAGAIVTGCSAIPVPPAIAGPPIVSGTVLDGTGLPVVGASVRLSVTNEGALRPTVFEATTTTDGAGRYVFNGEPSPDLLAFAGGGGAVTFDIEATSPSTGVVGRSLVERRLAGSTWDGAPPTADVVLPVT